MNPDPSPDVPVTLLFSDGVSLRLPVAPGGNLVQAAVEAGLCLLTDCANGQCGTCSAQLLSGAVEMDDYDTAVLPDEDRAAGGILPCVCRIDAPCAIELPYDSSEALADPPAPIPGTVTELEPIASETIRLRIAVPDPVDFAPGQYMRIQPLGSDITRSYSMANRPGETSLEFFIRLVPDGAFSRWLGEAKPGDQVELSAPHGTFFLRDEAKPRLFVAGGTGIAPFLSMLRSLRPDSAPVPTTLLIGARTPEHLIAIEEIESLRRALPGLELRLAVEQQAAAGQHPGYATDLIPTLGLPASTRVYLCGPPPMVEAGRHAVQAAGLARQDVLCERFT